MAPSTSAATPSSAPSAVAGPPAPSFFVVREIQSQLAALSRFSGRPADGNVSPSGFASCAHGPWIYDYATHAYAVYELFERMAYYGVAANQRGGTHTRDRSKLRVPNPKRL